MVRTAVISSFLFALTVTNLSAQNPLPESAQVVYDSLNFNELPYLPSNIYFAPRGEIHHILPLSSTLLMPPKLTIPETMLFYRSLAKMSHQSLLNAYSHRMPVSNIGYMPLITKGDYALGLAGSLKGYPAMGYSNSLSVGHNWSPTDWMTLYGGAYASDNMYHTTRFKDFGVSGRVRVQVAERVFLNGYGNYSIYNGAGGQQLPPLMYSTNYYGGSVEVKITDKLGLQAGAQQGFNMFTRQWETSYYILPTFY
jgi:hypothetical protein